MYFPAQIIKPLSFFFGFCWQREGGNTYYEADYLDNDYSPRREVPSDVRLSGVMSLRQCIHSLYSVKTHKASSLDNVGNMTLSKSLPAVARHYRPLLLLAKVQFTAAEPVDSKGSISHTLLKHGKVASRVKSFRSVSLKNAVAKHHHFLCAQGLAEFSSWLLQHVSAGLP